MPAGSGRQAACALFNYNGAKRALIPIENKRNFLDVSGDIVEKVDPIFFSDPLTAAVKALGMS
jgi:ATP-dependent Lon protease